MQLLDMFYDQIEDTVKRKVPYIIPVGTMEYHARHLSVGTDTLLITGCLRELEKEKEIVVCPPVWYGVSSYAVCGYRPGHFHVNEDTYADYIYDILKSMIYAGNKNIYLVVHHQTEDDGLMPMTIACHKAAKKVIMEYMEENQGKGWWGSENFENYYSDLGTGEDPFSYIKVISLIGREAQKKCGGFDHAGEFETSFILGTWPENADLERRKQNNEWFAKSASSASTDTGAHMLRCTLEWLRDAIF